MIALWIALGVLGFLVIAVLAASYVCYRIMLYSKPRRILGEDEYDIPEEEIYEVFREDMIAWTKMIRAYPYKEYSLTSHDGLTLRAKFFEYKPGAPIELMFHGYRGNAERDLNGGVERCFQLGHSALLIDHLSHETDEILHIELVVISLLGLDFDREFSSDQFSSTFRGIQIVERYDCAAHTATFEATEKKRNRQ